MNYESFFLYLSRLHRQHTYRKRLAIPCNWIWTIQVEWEEWDALTGYIMGLCSHYSRKCEHIHSYSFSGSPEPSYRVRANGARTFFYGLLPGFRAWPDVFETWITKSLGYLCHCSVSFAWADVPRLMGNRLLRPLLSSLIIQLETLPWCSPLTDTRIPRW